MEDTNFPVELAGRTLDGLGLPETIRPVVASVSMPNRKTLIVHTTDVFSNAVITAELRSPLGEDEPGRACVSVLARRLGAESVIAEALPVKHSERTPDPDVVTAIVKHFVQEYVKTIACLNVVEEVRRLAAALLQGPDLLNAALRGGVNLGVERDGSDVFFSLRINMGPNPTFGPRDLYGE